MSNIITDVENVYIDCLTAFRNNKDITSVNCKNVPWGRFFNNELVGINNMDGAFSHCTNLQTVKNISKNTNSMRYAFYYCENLSGDIVIRSPNILDADECFNGSLLPKNVYIPLYDELGNETRTFRAFKSANYLSTNGIQDNVTVKDIVKEKVILRLCVIGYDIKIYIVNKSGKYELSDGLVIVKKNTVVKYKIITTNNIIDGEVLADDDKTVLIQVNSNYIDIDSSEYRYTLNSGIMVLDRYIGENVNIIVPILKERT